jgi:hypothetical protein
MSSHALDIPLVQHLAEPIHLVVVVALSQIIDQPNLALVVFPNAHLTVLQRFLESGPYPRLVRLNLLPGESKQLHAGQKLFSANGGFLNSPEKLVDR